MNQLLKTKVRVILLDIDCVLTSFARRWTGQRLFPILFSSFPSSRAVFDNAYEPYGHVDIWISAEQSVSPVSVESDERALPVFELA